jgi:hypothetical protein
MDRRIYGILKSLLVNIDVLDSQVMGLLRSEQFRPDEDCMRIVEHIRTSCTTTLQSVESLERAFQGSAFVIPKDVMTTLESE